MRPSIAPLEREAVRAFAWALPHASAPAHLRFGSLRVRAYDIGVWEPDERGPQAVVLNVPDAEPLDLLAWPPERPDAWWRRSECAVLLGTHHLARADFFGAPLVVHSTPERWLFARGRGVCVVDWTTDLRFWLGGHAQLVAHSKALARRLDGALGRHVSLLQPTSIRHAS